MPDLFDTSRISDSGDHWDALAAGIARHATRDAPSGVIEWLAHSHLAWVAASMLIAVAMGSFWLLSGREETSWEGALVPEDAMGRAIASPARPPTIGTLIFPEPGS